MADELQCSGVDIDNASMFYFNVVDYTGNYSLSSYTLPITPLTFVPITSSMDYSNTKILWDFGDGSSEINSYGKHAYSFPGVYKVTCYLYTKTGDSIINKYSQNVTIFDYIPEGLTISAPLSSSTYSLTAGNISKPVTISRVTSFRSYVNGTPDLTITPFASGSVSDNYFDNSIYLNRYDHLYPYSSFYSQLTSADGTTEFVEISNFNTSSTNLYFKISSAPTPKIVPCLSTDLNSAFAGTSGNASVYFKSDKASSNANLMFGYQPNITNDFNNSTTVGVSCNIAPNNDYYKLSITSSGIDTEGGTGSNFNINKNKFSGVKIGFVVKIKDRLNFTIKDTSRITSDRIILKLTNGVTDYPAVFTDNFGELSALSAGGFYKGYVVCDTLSSISNVYIAASASANSYFVTGSSSKFDIYPAKGIYKVAKKNENMDLAEKFKEISFQPLFLDQHNLYNEFLASIFGSSDYNCDDQHSLGRVAYEKIANFVDNNAVLDYANVDKLIALTTEYGYNNLQFNSSNYQYPAEVASLVDLLSINRTRLFGTQNKFSENFNTFGYLSSSEYGTNIGREVSLQYTVTAGKHLVAMEKYSNKFTKLNTYQPVGVVSSNTYKLSAYTDSWGWELVLPSNGYGLNLSNYYLFYEYIPGIEGTISDSIINFDDPYTTLTYKMSSYDNWSSKDGIISNILTHQFYKGLNLLDPCTNKFNPTTVTSIPTVSISVSNNTIYRDDIITLSWSSTNASHVFINSGVGIRGPNGSIQLQPQTTTTYTINASNALGSAIPASTTVTVNIPLPLVEMVVEIFTVAPTTTTTTTVAPTTTTTTTVAPTTTTLLTIGGDDIFSIDNVQISAI